MVGDVVAERYELEELVGSGGMSSVYRARDRVLERTVALKVLHRQLADDDEYVERFRREAQMVAGLLHHNIVTVIDRGEDDGTPFIVFEYVGGENLKQLVEREGPLPIERALELAIQIAHGLAFAHQNGYIHRDVKPQNVLLNGNGEAKVTDFGIARSLDLHRGVTQTGTVLGTSEYIAPEQAQGQHVDEHTDVYSLGDPRVRAAHRGVAVLGRELRRRRDAAHQRTGTAGIGAASRRSAAARRRCRAGARETARRPVRDHGRLRPRARGLPRRRQFAARVVLSPPQAQPARRARRRPRVPVAAIFVALGLAIAVAVLAVVIIRNHGSPGSTAGAAGTPVALSGVTAYDPPPGNGNEHNADAPKATDGNAGTFWETEDYRSPLAASARQGSDSSFACGRDTTLHHVTVTTDTPGFTAEIQAGDSPNGPFHTVSSPQTVNGETTFDLTNARGSYFVVWITNLGTMSQVHVNEVTAN